MDWLSKLREPLMARGERARNRPFLEAAMASAALVAAADGSVSFAKRHALDEVLDGIDALRAFDAHGAVDLFDGLIAELQERPEHGRANALRAIAALAGERDLAELLLRVGRAIAGADGAVSARAKTA